MGVCCVLAVSEDQRTLTLYLLAEEGEGDVEAEQLTDGEQHGAVGGERTGNARDETPVKALDSNVI